jgi:hypothetical protein
MGEASARAGPELNCPPSASIANPRPPQAPAPGVAACVGEASRTKASRAASVRSICSGSTLDSRPAREVMPRRPSNGWLSCAAGTTPISSVSPSSPRAGARSSSVSPSSPATPRSSGRSPVAPSAASKPAPASWTQRPARSTSIRRGPLVPRRVLMASPTGRDDCSYGILGPRLGPRTRRTALSEPCPVVTMAPSATRDDVVTPIRSAYALTNPAPASPMGSTDRSATNQPEAMTSPASREDSGPMESVATRMRTLPLFLSSAAAAIVESWPNAGTFGRCEFGCDSTVSRLVA